MLHWSTSVGSAQVGCTSRFYHAAFCVRGALLNEELTSSDCALFPRMVFKSFLCARLGARSSKVPVISLWEVLPRPGASVISCPYAYAVNAGFTNMWILGIKDVWANPA